MSPSGKGDRSGEGSSHSSKRWLTPGILGLGLTSFFADMSYEMVTAVLPMFLATLGGGAAMLGAIEGIADAASSFVKLGMGYYSDRIGRRKPIILLGYAMSAAKGLLAFATSPVHILLVRILAWMGRGVRGPVRDALMADLVDPAYYGRVFGFHRMMDTAGAIVGPLIAMSLIGFLSFHSIFLVAFIPALLAIASVVFLVQDKTRKPDRTAGFRTGIAQLPSSFRRFLVSAGIFGLGNFAHTLLILRASELLTRDHGPARAANLAVFLYMLHNVFYAACSYPVGRLSDRIGKRTLLGLGYFLFALMSFGFIFVSPIKSYIGWLPALLYLVVLFVLAGIYIALVDSMEGAFAAELLPESLRGTGYGMLGLVKGVGNFISSFTVGILWSTFSPTAGFIYAALMAIAGGILLYRVPGRSDG
jgi:MFS family permease